MNTIRQILGISDTGGVANNQVVITNNTFPLSADSQKIIANLLINCYSNLPIVITGARADANPTGNSQSVTITGQSEFLNCSLATELTITSDAGNITDVLAKYTLIGAAPVANGWHFSSSFKELPTVINYKQLDKPQTSFLDGLILYNSFFLVTSTKQAYETVTLEAGINFYSSMRPADTLGIFETLVGGKGDLILYGVVQIPFDTDITPPVPPGKETWQLTVIPPGINLYADLKIDPVTLGEKLAFGIQGLRMYSPLSQSWMDKNNTYKPVVAYTGMFAIPSAEVEAEVIVKVPPGSDRAELIAEFENASLESLARLADVTGPGDTGSMLPDEIKSNALGKLQLIKIAVIISLEASQLAVEEVSVTVGMPDIGWKVWDDHFAIDSIVCRFDVHKPFATATSPAFNVVVTGMFEVQGVRIQITAQLLDNYFVQATLADSVAIPLKDLVTAYIPEIPPPSDLTINALNVIVAPSRFYTMMLMMAQQPNPWTINLGPVDLVFSNVSMFFMKAADKSLSGSFGGTVQVAGVTLAAKYDLPGDVLIRGDLPSLTLSAIISALTNDALEAPDGFDLTFDNSYVIIEKKGAQYLFQLGTMIEEFGALAFVIERTPGGDWGFAAGLAISTAQIASMKGVSGFVQAFEEWFPFDRFILAVSSIDDQTFDFPDFEKFNTSSLSGKIQLPASVSGIQKGFYLYTSTVFTRKNKILAALIDLVKIPEGTQLDVMLAYLATKKQLQLGVSLTTFLTPAKDVTKRSAQGDLAYDNTTLTGTLFLTTGGNDGFTFGLSAAVKTCIQGSKVDFTVIIYALANGFFISGTMNNKQPICFGPVQLAGLAIELGISFEGLPSVGFSASIDIEGLGQSSLAVLIDSADPAKSMIAGAISDLNLKKIVDGLLGTLDVQVPGWLDGLLAEVSISGSSYDRFTVPAANAGAVIEALDNYDAQTISSAFTTYGKLPVFPSSSDGLTLFRDTPGSQWYITSLTGTGESSLINHYELSKNSQGGVDVAKEAQFYFVPDPMGSNIGKFYYQPGMMVSGELQFMFLKLDVDVECVLNKGIRVDAQLDPITIGSPSLFSLTAAEGDGGPKVSICTYHRDSEPVAEFKDPHFYVNGKLVILAVTRSMFISISSTGATFDIKGDLIPLLVTGELSGSFDSYSHMKVGGNISAGIGDIDLGLLGTFKIETGVAAAVDIFVNSNEDFGADLTASFELMGSTHSLGTLTLDVKTQDFTHLPQVFYDAVKKFLTGLFGDAKVWVDAAVNYLKWGWGKIEGVLNEAFKDLSPEQIKALLSASFSCAASTAMSWM